MSSLSTPASTGVPCPRKSSNICSRLTFSWVWPALKHKDSITDANFFDLEPQNTSQRLVENLTREWKKELAARGRTKARLWRAFLKSFGWNYFLIGLYPLSQTILRAAQTVFLGLLVSYFNDQSVSELEGYMYGLGVVGMGILNLFVHHQFFFVAWQAGTQMRAAAMSVIMQKTLDVRLDGLAGTTAGYVVNLASSDVERFIKFGVFSHYIWVSVVEGLVVLGLMYYQVGAAAFIGYGVFLLLIPLQVWFSKLFGRLRQQTAALTDERVRVTNQVLNGIRIIKMFAWEAPFAKMVVDIREREMGKILRSSCLKAVNDSIFTAAPLLFSVATFVPYYALGNTLTPSKVFTVTSLFWMVQLTVAKFFPMCFEVFAEARIAFRRIQAYLQLPDAGEGWLGGAEMGDERNTTNSAGQQISSKKSQYSSSEGAVGTMGGDDVQVTENPHSSAAGYNEGNNEHIPTDDDSDGFDSSDERKGDEGDTPSPAHSRESGSTDVRIEHATYSWGIVRDEAVRWAMKEAKAMQKPKAGMSEADADAGKESATHEVADKSLDDVTFSCPSGSLTAVAGPVGSGKTTLLLALLGELPLDEGAVSVNGTVAYVPQQPWIITGSVRENILFGKPLDAVWYKRVVEACCLEPDFQGFERGDETLIGERGINLSGGQKARIGLARACYRNPDVLLLDDPLSAVDAKVARALFHNCIGGLMKSCTRVLVTHQLQFLGHADKVVVMDRGKSVMAGTFEEVRSSPQLIAVLERLAAGGEHGDRGSVAGSRKGSAVWPAGASVASLMEDLDDITVHTDREGEEPAGAGLGGSGYLGAGRSRLESLAESATEREFGGSAEAEPWIGKEAQQKGHRPPAASSPNSPDQVSENTESPLEDLEKVKEQKSNEDAPYQGVLTKEGKAEGTVSFRTYLRFWSEAGGWAVVVGLFLLLAAAQALFNLSVYWLSIWSNESAEEQEKPMYYQWFLGFSLIAVVLVLARTAAFYMATLKASQSLHDKMLRRVIQAFVTFFDANPTGRILNRFGKDMSYLDDLLPQTFFDFTVLVAVVLATIIIVCMVNPWVLLSTVPLMIGFFFIRQFYLKSAREVKRIEAMARSPVYSLLTEVLHGLPTLRSLNAQRRIRDAFHNSLNANTRGFHMFMLLSRWLGWRLDFLVMLFVTFTVLFGLLVGRTLDAALMGMAVSYTLQLSGSFQWMVRQSAEVENQMVSAERCFEYSELPIENIQLDRSLRSKRHCCTSTQHIVPLTAQYGQPAELRSVESVPSAWPTAGEIEFRNLWMRYRPDLEPVLKGINVRIPAGTKVGVVGRTGAGKSSCIAALYRLVEPLRATPHEYGVPDPLMAAEVEGSKEQDDGNSGVYIDGVRTFNVPLPWLRSNMSIIPQDPWLSNGTVRYNLDPFDEHSDDELLAALRQVQLHRPVQEKGGLKAKVSEGGSNFSVGQRQLLCLARAMLRKTRILIMDEPTANVDLETDETIHEAIHNSEAFRNATVITIAHRLATIISVDLVLVLSHGRLLEADHPHLLLQRSGSAFAEFVSETGTVAEQSLRKQAAEAWQGKQGTSAL